MNGCHLRSEHCLDFILRLDAFDHGEDEIQLSLFAPARQKATFGQLFNKPREKILICRSDRLHDKAIADSFVWMIRCNAPTPVNPFHLKSRRCYGFRLAGKIYRKN